MAVSPFLYKIINNREIIAANINNPSLPNSLLVQPYAIKYNHYYIQAASSGLSKYVYQSENNNCTVLWYELEANHTYLILSDSTPGTRFRWIKSSSDISSTLEDVSCEAVYNKDNPQAYMNFIHTVTQRVEADDDEETPDSTAAILVTDKYLGCLVDNAGNYNTRAYILDITNLV